MMKFLRLLRLHYSFLWALPYFIVLVYLKGLYRIEKFDMIFVLASIFYMISVNVHNDLCDKKLPGYPSRFLKMVIIIFLAAGIAVFPNPFVIAAATITYLYNWKLKNIVYVSLFPPAAPALAIAAMLGIFDPALLISLFFSSLALQSYHQIIDGEMWNKNYLRVFILSTLIALYSFAIIMFPIDVAVSWALAISGFVFGLNAIYIKNIDMTTRKLVQNGSKRRKAAVAVTWILLVFTAGWYFLL